MKKKINATVNAIAILWAFCLISWLIFLFRMTKTAILKPNNCAPIPMPVKTLILSKSVNRKLRLKSGIMQHRIPIIPKIKERCNNLFSSLSIQLMGEGLGFVDLIKLKIRSEDHTSELQSRPHLVCRLLLEKKKKKKKK